MPPSSADAVLEQRYGAPRKGLSRRARVVLVIAALAAAFGVVLYFTIANSAGELRYKDVGYSISSDFSASVDYEVTKDFDTTAQCMLTVLDDSYAIVGAKTVTLGPHEGEETADRSQYYRTEVRTEARGVTGIVDDCWEVDDA